jgi:hypothetical protein
MEEKTNTKKNKIIDEECYRQFQEWERKICELHEKLVPLPTKEEMLDQNNIIAYFYDSIEFWVNHTPTIIKVSESSCIIDALTQLKFRWSQIRLSIVYKEMEKHNVRNEDLQLYKLGLDICENND